MLGPHIVHSGSYQAKVAIPTRYCIVVLDVAEGTCKLPTAAADAEKKLGIAQASADVGDMVEVAEIGSSFLKVSGAISLGAPITVETVAGKEGWGKAHTQPAAPAGASNPPVTAEVDAVRDYVTDTINWLQRTIGFAEQASTASGDLIVASLGRPAGVS